LSYFSSYWTLSIQILYQIIIFNVGLQIIRVTPDFDDNACPSDIGFESAGGILVSKDLVIAVIGVLTAFGTHI
jgi:hypothetical protein